MPTVLVGTGRDLAGLGEGNAIANLSSDSENSTWSCSSVAGLAGLSGDGDLTRLHLPDNGGATTG